MPNDSKRKVPRPPLISESYDPSEIKLPGMSDDQCVMLQATSKVIAWFQERSLFASGDIEVCLHVLIYAHNKDEADPWQSMGELAAALDRSAPSMTELLDRLGKHGILLRQPNPINRKSFVVQPGPALGEISKIFGKYHRQMAG